MDNQFDSESYWNRSTSKAFSFDDESDFCTGTESGIGVGAARTWDMDSGSILNDDTISEASFDNSASSALNLSIKSVISEEDLKTILMEQSLDDRIIPKGVTPEDELKLLRRQIQTTLYNPSPEATAHKLLLGKTVILEVFKSLNEKEQLLDVVLKNGGGDAVIYVLLFLKKTLNRKIFYRVLQQRPKALEHYISYLKQRCSSDVVELLHTMGRVQEAAITQFRWALADADLQTRKQKLHQLVERYSNETGIISLYKQSFHNALKMLELVDKERHSLDNLVSLNSTPVEVLYACCRKNTNWKEQDLLTITSPYRLCAEQQISAAQFEWTALNERTIAQAYADLENIFERVPTWHPMKQKQFHISFSLDLAILRLHELKAPVNVLYMFLSKVSNSSEKLELAQRVKCTKAIIDALASLKESTKLAQMRDTLPERSEEHFYCEKALKALQSKRWSTNNINIKLIL